MRTWSNVVEDRAVSQTWPLAQRRASGAGNLHFVTAYDLQDLRGELAKRRLPPDLEAKLTRLALGSLSHRFIEQNCRTIIALLLASEEGSFREASRAEPIPDYRPDGFTDDPEAVLAIPTELNPLLQAFKAWSWRSVKICVKNLDACNPGQLASGLNRHCHPFRDTRGSPETEDSYIN